MKLILLCLLFIPIIYLALRQKKWYLCLLFAFLSILPEQLAIDLHEKLPLISASRLLIVLVAGFWLWDRIKAKRFTVPKTILVYLVINIIVSLVNFRFGAGEINRMFLLVFERTLPVIMLADMIRDREEFDTCVDFLILGCCVISIVGIAQTVFDYDIYSPLHLVETLSSITLFPRMGLNRAYGMDNAISFGCYCAMMILFILYRLYNTKKWYYSVAMSLVVTALICSLTRSAWLCVVGVFFLIFLFCRGKLIVRMIPAFCMTLALCIVLCLFQPNLKNAFVETGKSSANTVLDILPDRVASTIVGIFVPNTTTPFDPSDAPSESTQESGNTDATTEPLPSTVPTAPTLPTVPAEPSTRFELDEDFGMNGEDPTYSRVAQWSAIEHMRLEGNLLFGLGYNALPEGRIHFFFDRWGAKWEPTDFLDVGLVALVADGGLIGALSFLGLLGYMLVYSLRNWDKKSPMDYFHVIVYLIPLFLLLNFLAAYMFKHLVWMMIALFYAYKRILSGNSDREALHLPK